MTADDEPGPLSPRVLDLAKAASGSPAGHAAILRLRRSVMLVEIADSFGTEAVAMLEELKAGDGGAGMADARWEELAEEERTRVSEQVGRIWTPKVIEAAKRAVFAAETIGFPADRVDPSAVALAAFANDEDPLQPPEAT